MKRLGLAVIVLFAFFLLAGWQYRSAFIFGLPRYTTYSGPVEDGNNALGIHGPYHHTIAFSPDEKHVAYIWSDGSYVHSTEAEGRPATLTESLEIRVRAVSRQSDELRVPVDSVDLRPKGKVYFVLTATLQFSPDSRYVAAICPRRMILVDLVANTNRSIAYTGELFGTLSWLESNKLCFSTFDHQSMTFWQWNPADPPANRTKIYSGKSDMEEGRLQQVRWSPNGRFVCLRVPDGTDDLNEAILDVKTGMLRQFPFSLFYQCWKPDSSVLLVGDSFGPGHRIVLIDPLTGKTDDLTSEFQKEFGSGKIITFVSPMWTPDGKYVVLYVDSPISTAIQTGYLIQPKPFRVALSKKQIIRWSPVSGWVFLQGEMSFQWINYAGTTEAPIQGWPNDWTWSGTGKFAAKVGKGRLDIIKPQMPPEIKTQ